MANMNADYSRTALLKFIDYLSNKGLMKQSTAIGRKAACNKVLGILDDNEAADLRNIDVDSLMQRFSNKEGSNYKATSLNVYAGRVKSALEDFVKYVDNPMAFKTNVMPNGKKPAEKQKPLRDDNRKEAGANVERLPETPLTSPAAVSIMPIPLRQNLTIYVQGLPFDLTSAEANKLANVIRAMALED
jgi:site-specific recombinase XerD